MFRQFTQQRGQALVIIVFGMVALIGMAGLAIDGSSVYSDRRHAQNAADTAVMASGLTKIRNPADWDAIQAAGYARAADNGFDDNGVSNDVAVVACDAVGADCSLPPTEPWYDSNPNGQWDAGEIFTDSNGNGLHDATDPAQYLQVSIDSTIPTAFARILGIAELHNSVEALAKAIPSGPTTWGNGQALVALMPGCKSAVPGNWADDPFTMGGSSVSVINGSGVFVNSACENPDAFTQDGSSSSMTVGTGGICVVGDAGSTTGVNPPPSDHCGTAIDLQAYQMPAIDNGTCEDGAGNPVYGSITGSAPDYFASAGIYEDPFPDISGSGTLTLLSGVYCLQDGISVNAGLDMTTDVDGNGTFDGSDDTEEGVLFYVHEGSVTFNGGANVTIGAMNNPATHPAARGYLIYLPPTNNSPVKLTGNNGSHFVGSILAPASLVTLEGSNSTDSLTFETQIIGFSVKITGSGNLNINYYHNKTGQAWSSPILQLYR